MRKDIPPDWETRKWVFGEGYTPLTKKQFLAPTIPAKGNRSPRPIYEAVGRSLSAWNNVEEFLHWIFSTLIQSKTFAEQDAFGGIVSLASRVDCVENATSYCFQGSGENKRLATKTRKHLELIRTAAARRNEIAHGSVSQIVGYGWCVLPSHFNPRKNPKGQPFMSKYRYNSKQILAFESLFDTLSKETFNLLTDIDIRVKEIFPLTRPLPQT